MRLEHHIHRHLDWLSPLEWVGQQPLLAVRQNNRLVAAISCPPDPPQVAWIRLFVVSSKITPERAWNMLWHETRQRFNAAPPVLAAAMPLNQWFRKLLETSGFDQTEQVVGLLWRHGDMSKARKTGVDIRDMTPGDLDIIARMDQAAFVPLWQNSRMALASAFSQSAVATVAEISHQVVGYQISTAASQSGHMARLAVLPSHQGKGIGYALVRDALERFTSRGVSTVTVNTQGHNLSSLAVYRKAGFEISGETFPVYLFKVS